ncbi:MAG: RNA methyltransferase [Lachnospiraceae bacterium]|nr:RNA methyltransferase [Lachnospiraceae bacterium]
MIRINEIGDLSNKELEVYKDLNEAELRHYYEPKGGIFIAESMKVIRRALDAGMQPESLLMEKKLVADGEAKDILGLLPDDILVYTAEKKVLEEITGYNLTGGMLCAMKRPKLFYFDDLLSDKAGMNKIAVLENVQNPTNTGAIFRSAAAFGVDGVILTKGCSDPLERRSIRVSMGTVFAIPWTYYSDMDTDIASALKQRGFSTIAMALAEGAKSLDDQVLKQEEKVAVMIGNEAHGLSEAVLANADHKVIIPMSNGVDSLNAAAASAVAFWELMRVREQVEK